MVDQRLSMIIAILLITRRTALHQWTIKGMSNSSDFAKGEGRPVHPPATYGTVATGAEFVQHSSDETAHLTSRRDTEGGESWPGVQPDLCANGDFPWRLPVNHLNVSCILPRRMQSIVECQGGSIFYYIVDELSPPTPQC